MPSTARLRSRARPAWALILGLLGAGALGCGSGSGGPAGGPTGGSPAPGAAAPTITTVAPALGAHDLTTLDPATHGLLYPLRVEPGSALATAGLGGAPVGADLTCQVGVRGTL